MQINKCQYDFFAKNFLGIKRIALWHYVIVKSLIAVKKELYRYGMRSILVIFALAFFRVEVLSAGKDFF